MESTLLKELEKELEKELLRLESLKAISEKGSDFLQGRKEELYRVIDLIKQLKQK